MLSRAKYLAEKRSQKAAEEAQKSTEKLIAENKILKRKNAHLRWKIAELKTDALAQKRQKKAEKAEEPSRKFALPKLISYNRGLKNFTRDQYGNSAVKDGRSFFRCLAVHTELPRVLPPDEVNAAAIRFRDQFCQSRGIVPANFKAGDITACDIPAMELLFGIRIKVTSIRQISAHDHYDPEFKEMEEKASSSAAPSGKRMHHRTYKGKNNFEINELCACAPADAADHPGAFKEPDSFMHLNFYKDDNFSLFSLVTNCRAYELRTLICSYCGHVFTRADNCTKHELTCKEK